MIAKRFRLKAFILAGVLVAGALVAAQQATTAPQADDQRLLAAMHGISSNTLFDYVKELASPKYQGRLTGTPGYEASARWCEQFFKDWKIKPAGDNGTYEQHFPNPYTLVLPGARLSMRVPISATEFIEKSYAYEDDYFPGSTSDSGTATADVVYVGYGITAPELGYDDYAGMDVKGKLVLVEPEVPTLSTAEKEPEVFKTWRPYSFHDYKAQNAAKHGAAGMLYNYHIANPNCVFVKGLQVTYVGRAVVNDVFVGTGKNHDELVKSIIAARKPVSFDTKKTMTVKNVTEHHPEGIGFNVVGLLEGTDPQLKNEPVIIGAHLDHLGMNDQLMPGANDNASADAVLLGVAEALTKSGIPLKRSVIFILFGAEEQGVKGSEWYVNHPVMPNAKVKGMINLESVGRGETITGGSGRNYPDLWAYFDRNNAKYIHRQVRPTQNANLARPRQDAAHFLWANIPTISFGTGGGRPVPVATYHTTHDTLEWITPEIMEDLARLVYLSVVDMGTK